MATRNHITAAMLLALIAGCGGGGSDTAVSANPPAPEPVAVPSPAPSPVPAPVPPPASQTPFPVPVAAPVPVPVPVTAPVAVPNPAPVPAEPPAVPPPSVSGAAVVAALTTPYAARFTSSDPRDLYSSRVRTALYRQTLLHTSWFTELAGRFDTGQVEVSLDAATGPGVLTFTGSGRVTRDAVVANLASAQFSIPAQVPLDQTLHEWKEPGTSAAVRLFVGSIGSRPDLMRVCWHMELPGALRVSCTRNLRSTGSPIGADSVNDLGEGKTFAHEIHDDAPSPRRVAQCFEHINSRYEGITDRPMFAILEFSSPNVYRDRSLYAVLKDGEGDGPPWYTSKDLGDGTVEETLGMPRNTLTLVRRGNSVETYKESGGVLEYMVTVECDYRVNL